MRAFVAASLALVLAGCGTAAISATAVTSATPDATTRPWPSVPAVPSAVLDPSVAAAADQVVATFGPGRLDTDAVTTLAASGDARLAWLIADLLRFSPPGAGEEALLAAFIELTGADPLRDDRFGRVPWVAATNLLIGWDLAAPPGYRERKSTLFLTVEPAWRPFFDDADAAIDWRWVSWGGVLIDDRAIADERPCRGGCIPALDDPALTAASEGSWYADWRPVFGLVVEGEAVAFPRNILEVHEMVNLTVAGRRIGVPYCTLCASAQAYLVDAVDGAEQPLVLRTTGLLSRSNKVMFDLTTWSAFNTFTGRAVTGPLQDAGVVLDQLTVVATTWGEWKDAHPETRIVARDGGIGRAYPDDPLEGRDEAGPIFPVGPTDDRLRSQERVVGAIGPSGPVAFPLAVALAELAAGGTVRLGEVEAVEDAGGLMIREVGGAELPSHQAFWFAWSQFHPETELWSPAGG